MTGETMLENQVEAYLRNRVRNVLGGKLVKMIATQRGAPDRLVLLPLGRMYLVELKRGHGGRLSELQKHWHAEAAALGTTVAVLHGRDDVDAWVFQVATELDPKTRRRGRKPKAAVDA